MVKSPTATIIVLLGLIIYLELCMSARTRKQYVSAAQNDEQQNREITTQEFRSAQWGNYQDLRKSINPNWSSRVVGVCNILVDIVRRLTQPRPEPGNQKKHELDNPNTVVETPKNNPDLSLDKEAEELRKDPVIKPMLRQLQQQIKGLNNEELSEAQRAIANAFGAYLPGAIRRIVQEFIGNCLAVSYDYCGHSDFALANGSHMNGEIGAKKNFEVHGIQEGGVPVEVEESDQEEGLISTPCGAPKALKMEPER